LATVAGSGHGRGLVGRGNPAAGAGFAEGHVLTQPSRIIAFSLIGGAHQLLHGAPVAAALSRRQGIEVRAYVPDEADAQYLREILGKLGAGPVNIVEMRLPGNVGRKRKLKILRLIWWQRDIKQADAVVTLERTSVLLKHLPGRLPPLVHIPHGVGGARKAGGSGLDHRFRHFDLALVAGQSDFRSTVDTGLLAPEKVAVIGQVKLSGLKRMGALTRRSLFANGRPTVLYNPHFHPRRGSWQSFGLEIIRRFEEDGRFNLIVAPHVRLFEGESRTIRAKFDSLTDPSRLIVDTGSPRSMDMTYTLAADIYLGDFSSQLYEFLSFPRPCVFIDLLGDGGCDDSKLPTMWSLGETVTRVEDVVEAVARAAARHAEFIEKQRVAMADAVGDPALPADELAADRILQLLDR
jgi:hypothetical protein